MESRKSEMSEEEKMIAEREKLLSQFFTKGHPGITIVQHVSPSIKLKSIATSTTGIGKSLQANTTAVMENGTPAPAVAVKIADNKVEVDVTLPSTSSANSTTSSYSTRMYGVPAEQKSAQQQGPEYTIRLLLDQPKSKIICTLKQFSHLTLGCTQKDEAEKIQTSFEKLAEIFKTPVTFKPEGVINLGSRAEPLWGVTLHLDENLRKLFASQFDSIMCPDKDGNTYWWEPLREKPSPTNLRCAHITIGSKQEDFEMADALSKSDSEFVFTQIDYRKVGRHNPHVTKVLEQSHSNTMRLTS